MSCCRPAEALPLWWVVHGGRQLPVPRRHSGMRWWQVQGTAEHAHASFQCIARCTLMTQYQSHCQHHEDHELLVVQAVCASGATCSDDCTCPSDTHKCDSGICKVKRTWRGVCMGGARGFDQPYMYSAPVLVYPKNNSGDVPTMCSIQTRNFICTLHLHNHCHPCLPCSRCVTPSRATTAASARKAGTARMACAW